VLALRAFHSGAGMERAGWSERDDQVNVARNRRQGASAPRDFREQAEILATLITETVPDSENVLIARLSGVVHPYGAGPLTPTPGILTNRLFS
jgi:hypothetical protein